MGGHGHSGGFASPYKISSNTLIAGQKIIEQKNQRNELQQRKDERKYLI